MVFLDIQNGESFSYSYNTADKSTLQFYIQPIIFLHLKVIQNVKKKPKKTPNN